MRFVLLLAPWVIVGASVQAQENPTKEVSAATPQAVNIEVRFADDSVVKMVLKETVIEVATKYGRLSVPAADLRRIEFGLRLSEEAAKRIDAAIAALGSANQTQRDVAASDLTAMRELALPSVRKAATSANREVAQRATELLESLTQAVPPERLHRPANDTIVTSEFTIVGRIETATLKARSPYFGDANLKLVELVSVRMFAEEKATRLTVDAGRFGTAQNAWMDTGIELRSGSMLQVTAGGSITLASGESIGPDGSGGRGPRGFGNPGRGGFNPNAGAFPAGRGGRGGVALTTGVLMGRIGENGPMFAIGSRFESGLSEGGRLYLRIQASPDGDPPTGGYNVRVTASR